MVDDVPDFMSIAAKRKLSLDDEWKIMSWRRIEPDSLLITIGKHRKVLRADPKAKVISDNWGDLVKLFPFLG